MMWAEMLLALSLLLPVATAADTTCDAIWGGECSECSCGCDSFCDCEWCWWYFVIMIGITLMFIGIFGYFIYRYRQRQAYLQMQMANNNAFTPFVAYAQAEQPTFTPQPVVYGLELQPAVAFAAPQQPTMVFAAPQQPAIAFAAPQQPANGFVRCAGVTMHEYDLGYDPPSSPFTPPQQPAIAFAAPQQPPIVNVRLNKDDIKVTFDDTDKADVKVRVSINTTM